MIKDKSVSSSGFSSKGFDDIVARTIKIRSVRKGKKGGYTIELKPNSEKEENASYHFAADKDNFKILRNNEPVLTPGGNVVTTTYEALAKRCVEHMNVYGEEYEMPYSIVCFLYSYLDFYEKRTKEELLQDILSDFEIDWTMKSPYFGSKNENIWAKNFGFPEDRKDEVMKWLKTLSHHQTAGVYVITAVFTAPNLSYILANKIYDGDFDKFARYFNEKYTLHNKKEGQGMYSFWPLGDLLKIFENYLFWHRI